ncbi:MAG: alpha/beta hydrolase [Candidatus Hydrogenedentota bacterium]
MRILIALALLLPTTTFAQATSENDERLRGALERFPQADTDGDGILTQAEGAEFRKARQAKRKPPKIVAPEPTLENVKYGPYDRNVYDIWLPESDTPTALIIFTHGGGFRGGDKQGVRTKHIVQNALDAGLAFAAINYRFAYTSPEDVNDPQKTSINNVLRDSARAVQHIRHLAADYNLDKPRIAMYGGSAGAGTSLFIGYHDDLADPDNADPVLRESTRLAAVGMLNGQYTYDIAHWDIEFKKRYGDDTKDYAEIRGRGDDFSGFYGLTPEQYAGKTGDAARADVDLINLISPDDPPTFIFCSLEAKRPVTVGEIQHDPLHAQLIEARAQLHGLTVRTILPKVRESDADVAQGSLDLLFNFFEQHLEGSLETD